MRKMIVTAIAVLGLVGTLGAMEIEKAKAPGKKKAQTSLGLYVTATEAGKYLAQNKEAIFIDVRSPSELKFIGAAARMDFHVPYKVLDDSSYMDKKGGYGMKINKYFLEEIVYELDKREIKKADPIFVTCRSGSSRAAPIVNALAKKGYTNVWTLVDGYEGGKSKNGQFKGERVKDGWLHSSLEWSWKVPKDKLWFQCKYKDLFSDVDKKNCK